MTKKKITEFKPLAQNPNAHTERGYDMLERSISDVGYTAPMVASSDGVILDGNARYEKSGVLLGDEVIVVESDGTKPIVHVRTDIIADSEQARKIVYLANRVAEVDLAWDAAQLLADLDAGVDLSALWTEAELLRFMDNLDNVINPQDAWTEMPDFDNPSVIDYHSIRVIFKTEEDMLAFARLIQGTITRDTKSIYYPYSHRQAPPKVIDES